MISQISPEQGIDFFIAYLARHADEISLKVPTDRGAYHLIKAERRGLAEPSLRINIPLGDDVILMATSSFPDLVETENLDRLAEDLAYCLAGFERDKDEMVENLRVFRLHALKVFKKLPPKSPLKFVSLDLQLDSMSREAVCVMTYEKLSGDASRTVATTEIVELDDIVRELNFKHDEQAILVARARELEREHADGAVDSVLVTWLEALGMDPLEIIQSAKNTENINVSDALPLNTSLFWKDGILTVGTSLSENIRYHGGFLIVRKCPKHFSGDVSGRKVSELITHMALPDDIVFASGIAAPGKKCDLVVALQYELFDYESGITW